MPEVKCALASSRCAESTGALKESSEFHLIVNLLDRAYPDGGADRLTSFPKILGLTTVTRASEMSAMALESVIDTRECAESRARGWTRGWTLDAWLTRPAGASELTASDNPHQR